MYDVIPIYRNISNKHINRYRAFLASDLNDWTLRLSDRVPDDLVFVIIFPMLSLGRP